MVNARFGCWRGSRIQVHISIKAARVNKGLTQAQVAEKMGISIPSYARIENAPDLTTLGRLRKLAQIFDVPLECLIPTDGVKTGCDR